MILLQTTSAGTYDRAFSNYCINQLSFCKPTTPVTSGKQSCACNKSKPPVLQVMPLSDHMFTLYSPSSTPIWKQTPKLSSMFSPALDRAGEILMPELCIYSIVQSATIIRVDHRFVVYKYFRHHAHIYLDDSRGCIALQIISSLSNS